MIRSQYAGSSRTRFGTRGPAGLAGCAMLALAFAAACGSSAPSSSGGSGNGGSGSGRGGSGVSSDAGGSGDIVGSGSGIGSEVGGSGAGGSGAGGSGAGGSGVGGSGVGGSGTDSGTSGAMPPCVTKGTQGAFIGDSYITGALSPALQATLDPILMMNGAVGGYINDAVAGTSMGSGGIALIPPQFDTALATSKDIRLVIVDGGGNDILLPAMGNCKNEMGSSKDPVCQMIVETGRAAAKTLMLHMADSGVKDAIYFFYPHIPPGSVLGGTNPNEMLDYAAPLVKMDCDATLATTGGRMACHFIDLRGPYGDAPYSNIGGDGVHPTQSGQTISATQIWNVMKSSCLGQPVSSGCCKP
jgi:hypothetical protein